MQKMPEFVQICPNCKSELQVEDKWIGMHVECPVCSNLFTVSKKSNVSNADLNETIGNNKIISKKTTPSTRQKELENLAEDQFVLNYLETAKTVNLIIFMLGTTILVVATIGWLTEAIDWSEGSVVSRPKLFWALSILGGLIPWCGIYFTTKFLLCWLRGIYRNVTK